MIVISLFSAILLTVLSTQTQAWRGVTPLQSSRQDVERALGKPKSEGKFVSSYEFAAEFVDVYYASGPPCGMGLTNAWRVPRDTVVSVRMTPKKQTSLSSVVSDLRRYRQTADSKDETRLYFVNDDEGLRYTAHLSGHEYELVSIDFEPNTTQNHLKCSSALPVSPVQVPPFDKYGHVSSGLQRSILDNFAAQLLSDKTLKGEVCVYVGENESMNSATKTAERIRRHLVRRGVPTERFTVKNGRRKHFIVELYLLPSR